MGVHIDTSEVDRLAVDLSEAPERLHRDVRKILEVGANKIKKGMRRDFTGHSHAPYIPAAIGYDQIGEFAYEIGVDKHGPQGGLGNILAFGTSNNAPVVDHTAALTKETPVIVEKLADAAEKDVLSNDKGPGR